MALQDEVTPLPSLTTLSSLYYRIHIVLILFAFPLFLSHEERNLIFYLSLYPQDLAYYKSHKMHIMNIYNELPENAIWDYIKHETKLYLYILNLLFELTCLCSYYKL